VCTGWIVDGRRADQIWAICVTARPGNRILGRGLCPVSRKLANLIYLANDLANGLPSRQESETSVFIRRLAVCQNLIQQHCDLGCRGPSRSDAVAQVT
jgi:hypothetical protein